MQKKQKLDKADDCKAQMDEKAQFININEHFESICNAASAALADFLNA